MTRLTGYARQEEPKWLYALLVLIVLLIIVLIFWGFSAVYSWLESQAGKQPAVSVTTATTLATTKEAAAPIVVNNNSGLAVEAITFSSGVSEDNQPVDQLDTVDLQQTGTLYCFTRISSAAIPQKIKHVWLAPDGHIVAEIELTLRNRPAVTYSYVSLYGGKKGRWQFQVRTADGTVVARKDLLAD
jgi:hypothetical protein